jgi:Zn finger protein HypA/HybF involved in hydrogenase expression
VPKPKPYKFPDYDTSTGCTECGYAIPEVELRYLDKKRVRCPHCGKDFVPVTRNRWPDEDSLEAAHRHCRLNRAELQISSLCGCFYCLSVFTPAEIVEWVDEDQTAICPKCPVDSVIGSASGYPITAEFLLRMHDNWF